VDQVGLALRREPLRAVGPAEAPTGTVETNGRDADAVELLLQANPIVQIRDL
jgi:hypothetical protein